MFLWSLSFAGHGWVLYTHVLSIFFYFLSGILLLSTIHLCCFALLFFSSFFLVIFSLVYFWFAINTFFVGCGSALSRKILLQFFLHS